MARRQSKSWQQWLIDYRARVLAGVLGAAALLAASAAQAAITWDGGSDTNWWFDPVNWSRDEDCPNVNGICYLPPAQDAGGSPVNIDAQINSGWNLTTSDGQGDGQPGDGEGVVYDPANDPNFAAAASFRYPTGSSLLTNSVLMRDYGPETLYRFYMSRNTTNTNLLTIKSGDLAIESLTQIGRSGSTAAEQNLGRVNQLGGIVRLPLTSLDIGQRESSGWGNGTWDYRGGSLEVSEEGTGALRLSHGGGNGPGGHGRVIVHNPASGGHLRAWNVQVASHAGVDEGPPGPDGSIFNPLLDPDGVTTGVGIFDFHFENGATRPVQVYNNLSLNNGTDPNTLGIRSSRLELNLNAAPPVDGGGVPINLGLIDVDFENDGGGTIGGTGSLGGTFSNFDGSVNYNEGATVSADFGGTRYNWTMTYLGNISWSDVENSVLASVDATGGKDVVLVGLSSEALPGLPGDYNNNGTVDAADYVAWRNGGPLENEGVTPGVVDQEDYNFWRAQFGNSSAGSGGGLAAGAVPEPGTLWLAAAGIIALLLRRKSA